MLGDGRGAVGQLQRDAAPAARDAQRPSGSSTAAAERSLAVGQPDGDDVRPDLGLELVRRAAGDDHAAVDDREPVAEAVGLLEVVRRQEQRHALGLQPPQLVPERRARGRIDAGRGLVEEQQPRPVHEPAGQVDAPAHAARVGPHLPVGGLLEAEQHEQLVGARARLRAREAIQAAHHVQVLAAGGVARESRLLHREADRAAHCAGLAYDVVARDRRAARGRRQERAEHAHRGGLAGAVGPEQAERLTLLDAEA